jgi:DNA-binding NtrC family response regulator
MIGETLAMQDLRKNIERLAMLDCPVIIRGETGTGKELAARIMHQLSPRRHSQLIAINCGCFNNDLLIEELFRPASVVSSLSSPGHEGLPEYKSQGTILLDQIEDLSPTMQLSMLKIIDSRKISLQDGSGDFPFDVRIIAASRYNLEKLAKQGKFREELYYRLNVFELIIPPLRERRDDIHPLCRYFLNRFSKEFNKEVESVSDEVDSIFMRYDFPGNVRELEHIIERAVILADGPIVEAKHLPVRFRGIEFTDPAPHKKFMTLAEMEKKYIMEVLEASGGNKSKTTKLLGISRAALWRKLKKFKEENQRSAAAGENRQTNSTDSHLHNEAGNNSNDPA